MLLELRDLTRVQEADWRCGTGGRYISHNSRGVRLRLVLVLGLLLGRQWTSTSSNSVEERSAAATPAKHTAVCSERKRKVRIKALK